MSSNSYLRLKSKISKLRRLADGNSNEHERDAALAMIAKLEDRLEKSVSNKQRVDIGRAMVNVMKSIQSGAYGKGWQTDTVRNPLMFTPSNSYPFLSLAKHYGVDYSAVLLYADIQRDHHVSRAKVQAAFDEIGKIENNEELMAQITSVNAIWSSPNRP